MADPVSSAAVAAETEQVDHSRLLATLMANLPGMAYRCRNDDDRSMEFVSEGCRVLTGYPSESLLGDRLVSFGAIIDPRDRGRVRSAVLAALSDGRRFELTYRIVTAGGEQRWVQDQGLGVGSDASGTNYLEGFITDVTARKMAETALAKNEQLLGAMLDHTFQFIGLLAPDGHVLRSNQTALDAVGVQRETVEGRYFWDTPWWAHSRLEQERLRDAVARAAKGEFVRFETTHPAKDGRLLSIDFSLKPVFDDLGGVSMIIPEGRDVTERKAAEQALRESEEKFAKAFRASPDAIAITDLETGRFIEANGGYERIFGAPAESFVGRSTLEMGLYRDPADRVRIVEKIKACGSVSNFELLCYNLRREPIVVHYSGESIEMNGRQCLVSVIHDITGRLKAEQALRESEEKFAKAFLACPDAMSVHESENGRYVDVNEGFLSLFGGTREEIIGRTPMELGLWIDPAARQVFVERLLRDGRVRNLNVSVRVRDGRIRVCEVSAERVEIAGRPHNVTVLNDITERIEAEQALRISEDKFARAFRASPDAISISELVSGRLIEVNEGFERLSGYARSELIGRTAAELGLWAVPGERERMTTELQRTGSVRNLPMQVRNRQGQRGEFLFSGEVVEIGRQPCLVIVGHDISDRLRAEQALRESEEKFAKAFLSSPQPLVITEMATGRYIDVNLGFERVSGYGREEVIGRTSLEINIWESLDDRKELFARLHRDGRARDMVLNFRRKDGGRLITLCSFETIELSGCQCLLSTITDITEQRRTEDQKAMLEAQLRQNQKLEALGTLAGGIAHDFNNILTAIIINQELALMDMNQPDDLRRRLTEIGRASSRAKDLVRQILTFSRQQRHEKLRQHLQMIIREALGLLRSSLPSTIEIIQDLSPDAPPVEVDASQIHQVVMNLCTNAAHAMRDQPGRLTVRLISRRLNDQACLALPGLQPGLYAWLAVTDTGHGMDATVLARIFEPFFTTKGPGDGTGLGLPMVHGIVRDHGGAIFVQSSPGGGTTFDLYFPEAGGPDSRAPAMEQEILPGFGELVMVVDDEEAICEAIGAMLRRIGYRVETFNDPLVALERFRAGPSAFNLLLTDRTMPRMSGPELIHRVRDWWPGLPVLLMSGLNSPARGEGPVTEVRCPCVAKPVDIAELSRAVRRALDAKPGPIR